MKFYDAVVIGFGKAGKTLAGALGDAGWRVALIEQSNKMYGGTCINIACIPTKTLLHDANSNTSYPEAIDRKDAVTSTLRQKNLAVLQERNTVNVYTGVAEFMNSHDVQITAGDDSLVIRGDKIFINTGTEPFLPPIEGLCESKRVYTSTSLMDLHSLPSRLAIIGGGAIGLEFATTYAKFGSKVTVIVRDSRLLPGEDDDVASAVQAELESLGINFMFDAEVDGVADTSTGAAMLTYHSAEQAAEQIETDAALVATGRQPVTKELNPEAAGVSTDERGYVIVDDKLQTTVPHIWALGDANGGPQFTYISLDDFRIVKDTLLGEGQRSRADRKAVPYTYFLDPPLARVGLTEAQARNEGLDISVAKVPVASLPRAHVNNDTRGLLKAIIDNQSRRIIGASLFCTNAEEVINIVSLAMSLDQDFTVLRDRIYTHPTMSEALNDLFGQI